MPLKKGEFKFNLRTMLMLVPVYIIVIFAAVYILTGSIGVDAIIPLPENTSTTLSEQITSTTTTSSTATTTSITTTTTLATTTTEAPTTSTTINETTSSTTVTSSTSSTSTTTTTTTIPEDGLEFGQPYIDGRYFYVNGERLLLRGVNKGGGTLSYGNYEYEDDYEWMALEGVNVVRRHFRQAFWNDPTDDYWYRRRVEDNIQWAANNEIYYIMDLYSWESDTTGDSIPAPSNEEFVQFWNETAQYFVGRYPNLIFEISNEPNFDDWWYWAQDAVDAIREKDPYRIIIVPLKGSATYGWTPVSYPISGGNISYDFHVYYYWHEYMAQPYGGVGLTEQDIKDYFDASGVASVLAQHPIIAGEFGVKGYGYYDEIDDVNKPQQTWFRNMMEVMTSAEYDMDFTAWCWDHGASGWALLDKYDDWDSLGPTGEIYFEYFS